VGFLFVIPAGNLLFPLLLTFCFAPELFAFAPELFAFAPEPLSLLLTFCFAPEPLSLLLTFYLCS